VRHLTLVRGLRGEEVVVEGMGVLRWRLDESGLVRRGKVQVRLKCVGLDSTSSHNSRQFLCIEVPAISARG
jgi:hypothetical protein